MTELSRRTLLSGAAAAGLLSTVPSPSHAASLVSAQRPELTHGVMSGDVTVDSAVVWARADRPGRLVATVRSGKRTRRIVGGWATPATDHTAKIQLKGLRSGADHVVDLGFVGQDGHTGQTGRVSFTTGDRRGGATSFVWTGDTAGQGWGINPDLGGMRGYRTMHELHPDFFVHAGDTVYADGPIEEKVVEPDGQVWRNLVIPEVQVVAQSLAEFRGRHRYNMMDANVRAMYADVPVIAQWDDHETVNNWYPGEIIDDDRYTERRADVLAARAKRAWREWQPIADSDTVGRRGRDGRNRIHRKIARGRHLDVFALDMRTYKSVNTDGKEREGLEILGREQREWLLRELRSSRATWKVISADLPLGLVVPDGDTAQEGIGNADPGKPLGREKEIAWLLSQIKRAGVKNVVWLTADVHYCAAHHYSPERAAFTDFDPFWEFVAGPISAGGFGPNDLDGTFGPRADFVKHGYANQSPRTGEAHFFGHVAIDDAGKMTVSLRDINGTVLYTRDLDPERC